MDETISLVTYLANKVRNTNVLEERERLHFALLNYVQHRIIHGDNPQEEEQRIVQEMI